MAQRFLTRRIYLDNIRWITVCIVVIYHVIYIFNGVQPFVRSDGTKDHKVLQRRTWKKQRTRTESQNGFPYENIGICIQVVI